MANLLLWPENTTEQVSKAKAQKLSETKIDFTFGQLRPVLKCIFIRLSQFQQLIKVPNKLVSVVCKQID